MPLYGPSTATATVSAGTNSIAIAGMDLTVVTSGMTISLGARDRKTGDEYIIAFATPTGTSGGTVTTLNTNLPAVPANSPFVIDTTGFLGTDASYAAAVSLALLQTLTTLLGPSTNLYSGSRQISLDKLSSTALSRILCATAGRTWSDAVHRAVTYTPTGGSAVTAETFALRAFPDGTTPVDALLIDLATGGCDMRMASVTMTSATTVDLGSAPFAKVAITGSVNITGFGIGKHLSRWVHIVDGGGALTYNATSLILPGKANIVTQAGDTFHATPDASGNWRVRTYTRASGKPLVGPAASEISDSTTVGRSVLTAASAPAGASALGLGGGDSPTWAGATFTGNTLIIAQYGPSIQQTLRVYNDASKDWSTVNGNGVLQLVGAANASVFQIAPGGSTKLTLDAGLLSTTVPIRPAQYTVATLPAAGTPGRMAYASNARVSGQAAGAGTGSLVIDNGSAWQIAGTATTAAA